MNKLICPSILSVLMTLGCASAALDSPAVLTQPSAETRQLIIHAIANMLRGAQVQIADDALTQNSILTVHRSLLAGRDLGSVDRFQLIINGDECFLVHLNTQNRQSLEGVDCVALATE